MSDRGYELDEPDAPPSDSDEDLALPDSNSDGLPPSDSGSDGIETPIGQEFRSTPEKGEELPPEEPGGALGVGFPENLGKYTTGLASRPIGGKMRGGFNLRAIEFYPSFQGSEVEAKAGLDGAVFLYTQRSCIQAEQYRFAGQRIDLYSRYLKNDSRAGHLKSDTEKANSLALQARLDAINREQGDFYVDSILPAFDALKAR